MKLALGVLLGFFYSSIVLTQYAHKDVLPELEGEDLIQELSINFRPSQIQTYTDARHFMFQEVYNTQDTIETIYAGLKRYLDPSVEDPIQYLLTGDQNLQVDTEHSYPRSKGAERNTNAGSDLHHLFPARKLINSSRGNLPFGEVIDSETESWYLGAGMQSEIPNMRIDDYSELGPDRFEPRENQKGNIARAMFYFYTMYREQAIIADPQFFEVMKEDICNWHFSDPVDSLEWIRSKMIGEFQGHEANPFVLDCSLAARLYCEEISEACALLTYTRESPNEEVVIYPNPANSHIILEATAITEYDLIVYDLAGRVVKGYTAITGSDVIDIKNLKNGIYFLLMKKGGSVLGRSKFVKH